MGSLELDASFETFRGRNVFITGHTGFKGSWLTRWLAELGANVHGFALPPMRRPNHYDIANIEAYLSSNMIADIRETDRLTEAVRAADPSLLIHMAAQPLVRQSHREPRETFDVNVVGTASVLDAVRDFGQPCAVLVVTSDKCYWKTDQENGCREDDPLGGKDPYSASKAAAEMVARAYRHSYFSPERFIEHGIQLATVRAGNVIGGGDWAKDRIVTDIVEALSRDQSIRIRNPKAVRPWQHVLDALSGYLLLSSRMLTTMDPALSSAWNFGPAPGAKSVADVVSKFVEVWGSGSWDAVGDPSSWIDAQTLTLNSQKALRQLGWRPKWNFETSIERTAAWYRAFVNKGSCETYNDIYTWMESPVTATKRSSANTKPLNLVEDGPPIQSSPPNPASFS